VRRLGRLLFLLIPVILFVPNLYALTEPAPPAILLTGNTQGLWVVRRSPDGDTYDVVAKPADERWRWIAREVIGEPVSALGIDRKLHLILGDPLGYLIYDLDGGTLAGRNPEHPSWPGDASPIALCPGGRILEDWPAGILAVVARQSSGPTTADSTRPPDLAKTREITIGVFAKTGTAWEHLSDCPIVFDLTPNTRVLGTTADKSLYVVLSDPDAMRNRLVVFSADNWREVSLDECGPESYPISLVTAYDRPVFVIARAARLGTGEQIELQLATYDPGKGSFSFQPVVRDAEMVRWDRRRVPLAARLADRLALVWSEAGELKLARCDFSGQFQNATEIGVFARRPPDDRGKKIHEFFVWSLLFAILIPVLFMRPKASPRPFALPPEVRPAAPVKRFLGVLIDYVPWVIISAVIFPVEASSLEEFRRQWTEMAGRGQLPANIAWFLITAQVLYAVYGILMEYRFGATLGKAILRMRVVGDGASRPDLRGILLRNLIRIIELEIPMVILPIFLLIFTRNRQRLGDMIARTTVIDTRSVLASQDQGSESTRETDSKGHAHD